MQAMYMDSLMTAMQVSPEPIVHCLNSKLILTFA